MIDSALQDLLAEHSCAGGCLVDDAMQYAVLAGGKRIRAVLTLAATELLGGDVEKAVRAACAIELVHGSSRILRRSRWRSRCQRNREAHMNDLRRILKSSIAVLAVVVAPLLAQQGPAAKPSFEVASIKRDTSKDRGRILFGVRGSRFVMDNATVQLMLQWAYRTSDATLLLASQIEGGPDWTRNEYFNLEAKPQGDAQAVPPAQLRLMMQSLLDERFQLKVHRETRQQAVYDLVVAKGGPKIRASEDQSPASPSALTPPRPAANDRRRRDPLDDTPHGQVRFKFDSSGAAMSGNAITLDLLIGMLERYTGRQSSTRRSSLVCSMCTSSWT